MAIDNPPEYARLVTVQPKAELLPRLYLHNEMQIFTDAEDSLDI